AEGGALPHPPGDELEGPRADLGPGGGHADHDRDAPATMRAFKRVAHHLDVAGAVVGVVRAADQVAAPFGHVDDMADDITVDPGGVDATGHAEPFAPFLLVVVDVDADAHVGPGEKQS